MNKIKNKFVIYTALFGGYDDLIEPKEKFDGCDFICFTDQKDLKSNIWEIRIIEECDMLPNMMNRKYKWLPHKYLSEYPHSLYVDSNIILLKNPKVIYEKYCDDHCLLLAPKHPLRKCIYDEAIACIMSNKAFYKHVYEQMKFYKEEFFPTNFGLSENNILFRKHNDNRVIELMEHTWEELNKWKTKRDQLCFFYVIWKLNFKEFKLMKENARENKIFFDIVLHKYYKKKNYLKKVRDKILLFKSKYIDRIIYEYMLNTKVNLK